jgi:hypothetical protein
MLPDFKGLPANNVQLFVRNGGTQIALGMNQVKFKTAAIVEIRRPCKRSCQTDCLNTSVML